MSAPADLLNALPEAVAAGIREVLPDLRECAPRPGTFDLAELKAASIRAPAVLVSIAKIRQKPGYSDGQFEFIADMAAYVVTRDRTRLPRDEAAANVCQAILPLIPGNVWQNPFLGPAENAVMRTLVTRNVKAASAALWAVTWDQPFVLQAAPADAVSIELYLGAGDGTYDEVAP